MSRESTYYFYPELDQLANKIAENRRAKGFEAPTRENIDQKLLLVIQELCEAFDHLRDGKDWGEEFFIEGKPDGFPVELADALIRLLDIMAELPKQKEPNHIAQLVKRKLNYNATRPVKHGRLF